jgi:hypothetical protein
MRVGQDGSIDPVPWVDIEITCRAVEPLPSASEQIGIRHSRLCRIDKQKHLQRVGGVMQDLLYRSAPTTWRFSLLRLPSEVSECLVGIGHPVGVFSFGDRGTFFSIGCHEFIGEFHSGRPTLLFANCTKDPAEG